MRVLRRKLFNRGGYAHRGTGITSGLDTPRRGLVTGPGGYAGIKPEMLPAWMTFFGNLAPPTFKTGLGAAFEGIREATKATAPVLAEGIAAGRGKERRIIKGADGYNYYADTGERVLKGITKEDDTKISDRYQIYLETDPTPETGITVEDKKVMGTFQQHLKDTDYIKTDVTDPSIKFQELETDADGTVWALFVDPKAEGDKMLSKIDTGIKAPEGTNLKSIAGQTFEGADKLQYQLVLEKDGTLKAVKIPGQGEATAGAGALGSGDIQLLEKEFETQKKLLEGTINPATNEVWTEEDLDKKLTQEYWTTLQEMITKKVTIADTRPILSVEEEIEKALKLGTIASQQETAKDYFDFAESKLASANDRIKNVGTLQTAEDTAILGEFQPTRAFLAAIFDQFNLDNVPALSKAVKFLRENFIHGEAPATDVAKAMVNLGTLANAENGALPGNLNEREVKILQESYPQLLNSPEGFKILTELYRRDALIDKLRSEAVDAYRFSVSAAEYTGEGTLSGTLFPEGRKVNSGFEATVLIKRKLEEVRRGMIDGFDEDSEFYKSLGWESLNEDITKVQSYGDQATNFKGLKAVETLSSGQKFEEELDVADADGRVEFIGYSDEHSKVMYDGELRNAPAPNVAMYAVTTLALNKTTNLPVVLIYGYQKGGKK